MLHNCTSDKFPVLLLKLYYVFFFLIYMPNLASGVYCTSVLTQCHGENTFFVMALDGSASV